VTASAIYEGWVRHRRFTPLGHEFRYRVYMTYLDLDELPGVLDPFPGWSARRPAPARFRRADYMGDPARPLAECARDAVEETGAPRPAGPVRLLGNLRVLGHVFNPICLYYCFDADGERVEAVVADVTNIPWGESHPYVMTRGEGRGPVLAASLDKRLHVSPLMGMDHRYELRASEPGEALVVQVDSRRAGDRPGNGHGGANGDGAGAGEKAFDATLSLRRRELSTATLTRVLIRYPAASAAVVGRIYLQALRLRLKGARWFPHPERGRGLGRYPGQSSTTESRPRKTRPGNFISR